MRNYFLNLFYLMKHPSKHSSWWRRLEDVFRFRLQKTSSRRLQDVLIKTNMFALALRLQKTSSRRLDQDQYIRLGHTSSRRLQNVFKTSSRRLQDIFKTSCKNVFKTSSRRLQDVLKTSSRHLQDVLQRYLQDVFKTYHQVKLFLLTNLRDVFNTFLRRTAKTVIYRRICLGHTSEKFMVSVQNLQERQQFLKF